MKNCISIIDAVTVSATMFAEEFQQSVVAFTICSIALKFDYSGNRGHRDWPGLFATHTSVDRPAMMIFFFPVALNASR
jgi:hypothetical protein